jgi:biotin carboxyl carrier protein
LRRREIESVQNIYGGLKTAMMEASMKRYNVTVNGVVYIVEVEEEGASAEKKRPVSVPAPQASVPAPQAPVPAPQAPASAPVPAPAPAPAAKTPAANAIAIDCPMPGNIRDILVAPGQAVKSGETLLVLEAMKMENEIVAPQDGVVDTIRVTKGASVNAGDVLITLL